MARRPLQAVFKEEPRTESPWGQTQGVSGLNSFLLSKLSRILSLPLSHPAKHGIGQEQRPQRIFCKHVGNTQAYDTLSLKMERGKIQRGEVRPGNMYQLNVWDLMLNTPTFGNRVKTPMLD